MFTSKEQKDLKKLLSYSINKDDALSLEGLHGILRGLDIIPKTVVPSEWLPGIFGEEMLLSVYYRFIREYDEGKLHFPFILNSDQQQLKLTTAGNS